MKTKFRLAGKADRELLIHHFNHYRNKVFQEKRVDCFIEHNYSLLMFVDEHFIGIIQWYVKEDPGLGVVEFEELFIRDSFRNKGMGTQLVKKALLEIEKKIHPLHSVFLFIDRKDEVTQHIFCKFKFKKVAEIPDLFKSDETVLLYLKTFS
ncbi:MAG: GNAT family N-acetyltransferase [Candidatus Hermodarchaeota archaeon]